jgi:hypothetical protein
MLAAVTSFVVGADASMACGVVARGAQVRVRVDALDGAQELLNMRSEISHDLSSFVRLRAASFVDARLPRLRLHMQRERRIHTPRSPPSRRPAIGHSALCHRAWPDLDLCLAAVLSCPALVD